MQCPLTVVESIRCIQDAHDIDLLIIRPLCVLTGRGHVAIAQHSQLCPVSQGAMPHGIMSQGHMFQARAQYRDVVPTSSARQVVPLALTCESVTSAKVIVEHICNNPAAYLVDYLKTATSLLLKTLVKEAGGFSTGNKTTLAKNLLKAVRGESMKSPRTGAMDPWPRAFDALVVKVCVYLCVDIL
jgi:hypothetical protein